VPWGEEEAREASERAAAARREGKAKDEEIKKLKIEVGRRRDEDAYRMWLVERADSLRNGERDGTGRMIAPPNDVLLEWFLHRRGRREEWNRAVRPAMVLLYLRLGKNGWTIMEKIFGAPSRASVVRWRNEYEVRYHLREQAGPGDALGGRLRLDGSQHSVELLMGVVEQARRSLMQRLCSAGVSSEEADVRSRCMNLTIDAVSAVNSFGVRLDGTMTGLVDRDARLDLERAAHVVGDPDALKELAGEFEQEKAVAHNLEIVAVVSAERTGFVLPIVASRQQNGNANARSLATAMAAGVLGANMGFDIVSLASDGDGFTMAELLPFAVDVFVEPARLDLNVGLFDQAQLLAQLNIAGKAGAAPGFLGWDTTQWPAGIEQLVSILAAPDIPHAMKCLRYRMVKLTGVLAVAGDVAFGRCVFEGVVPDACLLDNYMTKQSDRICQLFLSRRNAIVLEDLMMVDGVFDREALAAYIVMFAATLGEEAWAEPSFSCGERLDMLTMSFAMFASILVLQKSTDLNSRPLREKRSKGGFASTRAPRTAVLEEDQLHLGIDLSEVAKKDLLAAVPNDLLKKLLAGMLVFARRIAYSKNNSTGSRYSGTIMQERLHALMRAWAHRDDSVESLEDALLRFIL
jgi:hypothetical protein